MLPLFSFSINLYDQNSRYTVLYESICNDEDLSFSSYIYLKGEEKGTFSSLFLMRKRLSHHYSIGSHIHWSSGLAKLTFFSVYKGILLDI